MIGENAETAGLEGEPDIENELLRRATLLARPAELVDIEPILEIVAFRLGGETYGIETRYLRSVVRFTEIARLAGTQSVLHGVTLIRGELLTIVDLRTPLGLSGSALNDLNRILVLGRERSEFGILADRMEGVMTVKARDVSRRSSAPRTSSSLVRGVTPDAVVVLDGDNLLNLNLGETHALDG